MTDQEINVEHRKRVFHVLLIVVIILGAILLYLLGVLVFSKLLGNPFGESLVMGEGGNVDQPIPTITLATQAASLTSEPDPTPTPLPSPTLAPMCNAKEDVVNFLLIAKDWEEHSKEAAAPDDYEHGFADAIRVVRVDFRDASVRMVSIPRDLMVSIPGMEKHGIYEERLKMAYAYGFEYDVPGGGPSLVAQTLASNFGFEIDHYVTLNYWAFVSVIETIGGIDIELAEDVGPFLKGTNHLSGWQALEFARIRDQAGEDTSDLSRIDRQTQVIFAVREKVFSPKIFPKIPALIPDLMQLVQTDLRLVDMDRMLCLAKKVEKLDHYEMDGEMMTQQLDAFGRERFIPRYDAIRRFVEAFQR
ncbi:MAG: LCP family protein, partial [Anaerolineaceae bacterium]|nr:LCP family protein [Anaerolineaceae bacterium]